jgi:hypothetical protein
MSAKEGLSDSEAIAKLIAIFEQLPAEGRQHIFDTLGTYLRLERPAAGTRPTKPTPKTPGSSLASFTEDRSLSAKEFMLAKQPITDVERVACLAYFLTHYQNQPHFKTLDISRLNTEAAQIKFSNAAFSVVNATNRGYLTQAGKGFKQISAVGEQFVAALPDRDAAKAVMASPRKRRSAKKGKGPASRSK